MMNITAGKHSSLQRMKALTLLFQQLLHVSIKRVNGGSKEQLLYRIGKSKLGCGN